MTTPSGRRAVERIVWGVNTTSDVEKLPLLSEEACARIAAILDNARERRAKEAAKKTLNQEGN